MQVEDHSEIEPALLRPDLADFTGPFLVQAVSEEVSVQKIRRNVQAVIAVGRVFELPISFDHNAVLLPQLGDLALLIGLGSWFLRIVPIFLYPAALCRKPDAKIRRNLVAAQGAGKCKTNCFRVEFRGWFLRHVLSAL